MIESDAHFGAMADSAPVLMWMSGADKGCTFLNKGWLDFTGWAIEEGVRPDDRDLSPNAFIGVSGVGGVYVPGATITSVPVPPPGAAFPRLRPLPVPATNATPLFLRIYDDRENFPRNVDIFCRCWGAHPVADIDPVYGDAIQAPRGTYAEMEGEPVCTPEPDGDAHCSFDGAAGGPGS